MSMEGVDHIFVQDFTLEPAGQSGQREKNKATG
jgi:hypothetical protein